MAKDSLGKLAPDSIGMVELPKLEGEIAAVVDGAVRDIDHSRRIGYPIWSVKLPR